MVKRLCACVLVLVVASGCIASRDPVQRNQSGIRRLAVNMTRENVHVVMGTRPEEAAEASGVRARHPFRTETYRTEGHEWEVLFYQTETVPAGQRPADEQLTPVVLLDGLLVGWGWDFWRGTAARNRIVLED